METFFFNFFEFDSNKSRYCTMTDKGSRRQGEARMLPLTYALSIPQQSNSEYYIYKDYNYPTPPPTLF